MKVTIIFISTRYLIQRAIILRTHYTPMIHGIYKEKSYISMEKV